MADDDKIIQEVVLEGAEKVEAQLRELGITGKEAFDVMNKPAVEAAFVFAKVEKASDNLGKSIRGASDAILGMGKTTADNLKSVADFFDTIVQGGKTVLKFLSVIGAVPAALFGLAKAAANATDRIRDGAIAAGTAADKFVKLNFVLSQSGGRAGTLERAYQAISAEQGKIIDSTDKTTKKFARFNIDLKNTDGSLKDTSDVFVELSDAISKIQNPAERSAAVMSVFGRRFGAQLVESLSLGKKGIEELSNEAARLGLVFSKTELEVGDNFNDALDKVQKTAGALSTRLGLVFAPAFTEGANRLATAIGNIAPRAIAVATVIATKLTPIFNDLISAITGEGQNIQSTFVFAVFTAVTKLASGLATIIQNVLIPVFNGWVIILTKVAAFINAIFGTGLGAGDIVAFAILLKFVGGFTALLAILKVVTSAFVVLRVAMLATTATPIGLFLAAIVIALAALAGWLIRINWTTFSTNALTAITAIKKYFTDLWASVNELWTQGVEFINTKWTELVAFVAAIPEQVVAIFTALWEGIKGVFNSGVEYIKNLWAVGIAFVQGKFQEFGAFLASWVQAGIDLINKLIEKVKSLISALSGASSGTAAAGAKDGGSFAGGGKVRGPGSSRSDSIWARLSNGEFVMRAKAVSKYGLDLMHAINSGRFAGGFNMGGLIDSLSPVQPAMRFADGGAAGGPSTILNLAIGQDNFPGLLAPEATADKLVKYARKKGIRSAGRTPRWYGGGR